MTYSTLTHIAAVCILLPLAGHAQNEQDAVNLSREEVTGSARTISMGGAFTALGGDLSGMYINPAGIAVFRSNEFSISPAFHTNITNTSYYGQNTLDSKSNLNIATLGIVGVKNLNQQGKWRSTAVGFGLHRNYSYHQSYTATGSDVPSSLIDSYANILRDEGITPDELGGTNPAYPFDIHLAWNNFLLDTLGGSGYYNATGILPIDQEYTVERNGAKRESFLSFGGNYDDRLYIGAGIIVSRISMERSFSHSEFVDPSDTTTYLREHAFNFEEEISGLGIGANIGIIYRPITPLRLGLSVKTPTLYSLNIGYESSSVSVFEYEDGTQDIYETLSPFIGDYDFRLLSPLQTSVGAAYVIGKFGLISADAELVNYTGMSMHGVSDGYQFQSEEQAIQTLLKPTLNLKFGAEYRITQFVSARAGYAHFGNPYVNSVDNNGKFELYSIGLGYRDADWFVDGSYQYKTSRSREYIYDPNMVEPLTSKVTDHRFALTFGFKF